MFASFAKFDAASNEKFCVAWAHCCLSTNEVFVRLLLICETRKMLIKEIKFDWIYFEVDKNDWDILKNNFYTQRSMLFFLCFREWKAARVRVYIYKIAKKSLRFCKIVLRVSMKQRVDIIITQCVTFVFLIRKIQ